MIKVNQELKSLIQTNISNLNDLIEKYYEGSPNSRYKSWEWCHLKFINAFNKIKNKEILDSEKESLIDDLSLNLGFYLASYGMYRGSCFSLRCDYKIYKSIVKVILDEKYDILWNYDPSSDKEYKVKELLFNKENGVIQRIKDAYLDIDESFKASNTLITKILLGTFACIPAFDTCFKDGVKIICEDYECSLKGSSKDGDVLGGISFKALCDFALAYKDELKITSNKADTEYPIMKCLDLVLWEIGAGDKDYSL